MHSRNFSAAAKDGRKLRLAGAFEVAPAVLALRPAPYDIALFDGARNSEME